MLSSSQMLATAIFIAADAHKDQLDKSENPYILHPLKVMEKLNTTDKELMAIAAMHDVFEDASETYKLDDLEGMGFSQRVIVALRLLTHDRQVPYEQYISDMMGNVDALRVKRADLSHNSDITRMKGLRPKDFERLEKYCKTYHTIDTVLKYRNM